MHQPLDYPLCFCFLPANIGAAVAGILFFGFYLPYLFLQRNYETMSLRQKVGISLLFNMAMSLGSNTIGLYEGTGEYINCQSLVLLLMSLMVVGKKFILLVVPQTGFDGGM